MSIHPNFDVKTKADLSASLAAIMALLRGMSERGAIDHRRVYAHLAELIDGAEGLQDRASWFVDYMTGKRDLEGQEKI